MFYVLVRALVTILSVSISFYTSSTNTLSWFGSTMNVTDNTFRVLVNRPRKAFVHHQNIVILLNMLSLLEGELELGMLPLEYTSQDSLFTLIFLGSDIPSHAMLKVAINPVSNEIEYSTYPNM
jgi:hypothetical protein